MHATELTDDDMDKRRDLHARWKVELISVFLNECGEHATWEEWRAFLQKYQAKGFEWTDSVS